MARRASTGSTDNSLKLLEKKAKSNTDEMDFIPGAGVVSKAVKAARKSKILRELMKRGQKPKDLSKKMTEKMKAKKFIQRKTKEHQDQWNDPIYPKALRPSKEVSRDMAVQQGKRAGIVKDKPKNPQKKEWKLPEKFQKRLDEKEATKKAVSKMDINAATKRERATEKKRQKRYKDLMKQMDNDLKKD